MWQCEKYFRILAHVVYINRVFYRSPKVILPATKSQREGFTVGKNGRCIELGNKSGKPEFSTPMRETEFDVQSVNSYFFSTEFHIPFDVRSGLLCRRNDAHWRSQVRHGQVWNCLPSLSLTGRPNNRLGDPDK